MCVFKGSSTARDLRSISEDVWDTAAKVVAGRVSLVAATERISGSTTPREVNRASVWALRNRTRFLLLKAVREAIGDRLVLTGSDWAKIGFDAQPTRHDADARFLAYRLHRVSLDLGSKSSHALLYPRSSDILAAGGGLVQFTSGFEDARWGSPVNTDRLVSSSGTRFLGPSNGSSPHRPPASVPRTSRCTSDTAT